MIPHPASIAFVLLASLALQGNAQAEPKQTAITTRAELQSKAAPLYPGENSGEGWVLVDFEIDKQGVVDNLRVGDSLGNRVFAEAAKDSVAKWKYSPAMEGGKPVRQFRNQTLVIFSPDVAKPSSRLVDDQIEMIRRLTTTIYRDEAKSRIQRILKRRDLNLLDLSKLWVLLSMYEFEEQNSAALNAATNRATMNHGEWIEASTYESLLILGVQAKLQLGLHRAAIRQFERLSRTGGTRRAERAELAGAIDKLKTVIASDDVIRVDAEIRSSTTCNDCDSSWRFTPVRDRFALGNTTGHLNWINIICDHHRSSSKVSYDVEWSIPASWGECDVEVVGDAGVAFSIFQLPDE